MPKRPHLNLPISANQALTTQNHKGPSLSGEAQESVGRQIVGVIKKKERGEKSAMSMAAEVRHHLGNAASVSAKAVQARAFWNKTFVGSSVHLPCSVK